MAAWDSVFFNISIFLFLYPHQNPKSSISPTCLPHTARSSITTTSTTLVPCPLDATLVLQLTKTTVVSGSVWKDHGRREPAYTLLLLGIHIFFVKYHFPFITILKMSVTFGANCRHGTSSFSDRNLYVGCDRRPCAYQRVYTKPRVYLEVVVTG